MNDHSELRHDLVVRFGQCLCGLAITLGMGVAASGVANAAPSCEEIEFEIEQHNLQVVDQTNGSAVDAYNAEADHLNYLKDHCA
ncbi:MAG TPA: hypothetical protein VFB19_14875 [Mycobacterium sp.]|nr:hypothetical protein [Mycobacterium sp.]